MAILPIFTQEAFCVLFGISMNATLQISRDSTKQLFSLIISAVSFVLSQCLSASYIPGQETPCDVAVDSSSLETASRTPSSQNSASDDPLAYANDRVKVKVSIAGVAQANGVTGSWWNLSDTFASSANYKPDRAWGESWIKPGITTEFF